MDAFAYANANFQTRASQEEIKARRARLKMHIEKGYARRWIRRNWWRALAMAGWIAAGILIRAAAAATRPEDWPVGGEIVPAVACWVMAAILAMGEVSPRKRRTRKQGDRRDI